MRENQWRLLSFVLALWLAGCGGGSSSSADVTDQTIDDSGPTYLFQESFDTFPGTNWTQGAEGSYTLLTDVGNPDPPSLELDGSGGASAYATANTTFSSGSGLGFYIFHAVDVSTLGGSYFSVTGFRIFSLSGGDTVASVNLMGTSPNNSIRYNIQPDGGTAAVFTEQLALDSDLHDYWFIVDSDRLGSWYRDGVLKYQLSYPITADELGLQIRAQDAVGTFDQVEVTQR